MPLPESITEADVAAVARRYGTGPAARWSGLSSSTVVRIRRDAGESYTRGRGHPSKEEMRRALPDGRCRCAMCLEWKANRAELRRLEEVARREAEEALVIAAAEERIATIRRVQAKAYAEIDPDAPGGWRLLAVCTEADHKLFYPPHPTRRGEADPVDLWFIGRKRAMRRYRPEVYEPAKAICMYCPVRESCLEYALESNGRWGVWGGLDWLERDLLAGYLPTGVREPPKPERAIEAEPELAELVS